MSLLIVKEDVFTIITLMPQMERNAEKTSTKRMGCPLHLYAKLTNTTQWELQIITLIIIIWLMKI